MQNLGREICVILRVVILDTVHTEILTDLQVQTIAKDSVVHKATPLVGRAQNDFSRVVVHFLQTHYPRKNKVDQNPRYSKHGDVTICAHVAREMKLLHRWPHIVGPKVEWTVRSPSKRAATIPVYATVKTSLL